MTRVWEPILDLTPVSGKWSISSPGKANYCGERKGPIGVCASKTPFVEGELCVQVRLKKARVMNQATFVLACCLDIDRFETLA